MGKVDHFHLSDQFPFQGKLPLHAVPRHRQVGETLSPKWPTVMEKGFAAKSGTYERLIGGYPEDTARVLEELLCREAEIWTISSSSTEAELAAVLDRAISNGPATVEISRFNRRLVGLPNTSPEDLEDLGLIDKHVYQLIGKDQDGKYLLGNPHYGAVNPISLGLGDLFKSGALYSVVGMSG